MVFVVGELLAGHRCRRCPALVVFRLAKVGNVVVVPVVAGVDGVDVVLLYGGRAEPADCLLYTSDAADE